MEILISGISLIIILAFIILACVLFTNAIEHLGEELNLSEGAVGSVLAAVGTALPETIVPIVAIFGAYLTEADMQASEEIGIGAILGAPFMLGTLAFFITGLAVLIFAKAGIRERHMPLCTITMFRDLHFFMGAYLVAIAASFIHFLAIKYFISAALVFIYAYYVIETIRTPSTVCELGLGDLQELYFNKILKLSNKFLLLLIFLQILVSIIGIIVLAHLFVEDLKVMSEFFHINPLILSLIITPIATELPEKFNSIIWIKNKKDTLAMGNITGAMVFQSCIPPAVGIVLTSWVLNIDAIVNVLMVYLSVSVVYLSTIINKGTLKPTSLLMGGLFYLLYLVFVVIQTSTS